MDPMPSGRVHHRGHREHREGGCPLRGPKARDDDSVPSVNTVVVFLIESSAARPER